MQFDKNLLFLENENFKSKNSNNGGENPPVSRLILPQLRGDEIQIEKRGDRRHLLSSPYSPPSFDGQLSVPHRFCGAMHLDVDWKICGNL